MSEHTIITSDEVNRIMRYAAKISGEDPEKFFALLMHAFIQACRINDVPDELMCINFTNAMRMSEGDGTMVSQQ
jgi:hypothetical protein